MPASSSSSTTRRRRRQSSDGSETGTPAARARSTSRKRKGSAASRSHSDDEPITLREYRSQPHVASTPTRTYTLRGARVTIDPPTELTAASSTSLSSERPSSALAYARSFLSSLFLPVNYPHSVTADYLSFQVYDTVQASSSYLRGLLCTQAILAGIGVGSAAATPASATLNWITRDGVGMAGGMLFAWYGARSFGVNVKRWRLFADLINDIGLTLELLSPRFPDLFLLLACIGTLCRALCGVAAGATRASLMSHFALHGNIADISAKEGIQETAVTLAGLVLGWQAVDWLDGDVRLTWLVFAALTAVHVWANVRAMRCLVLTALDTQRAELCVRHFLAHRDTLTPAQAAQRESLVWPLCAANSQPVQLGVRLPQSDRSVSRALRAAERVNQQFVLLRGDDAVRVVLREGASEQDVLSALFHARLYWDKEAGETAADDDADVLRETYDEGEVMFELFAAGLLDAGWKSADVQLNAQPWRYDWTQ